MMICLLRHKLCVVKKSWQMCNLLLYAFPGLNNNILVSLYNVYVRSLLDYALITFSPHYVYLIDLLENFPRNFTKKMPSLCNFSYISSL